ncbi:hypothetical protein scyTo_0006252 [Scyliorhinus torazame]|uniref:Uncharacterized protein n=1 Tax=Scyliorhinus torazame TaxID=75743 RepID=A0A401PGT7_SCYTO|nr:hypothetical protein [Scyliorhinus torazame]
MSTKDKFGFDILPGQTPCRQTLTLQKALTLAVLWVRSFQLLPRTSSKKTTVHTILQLLSLAECSGPIEVNFCPWFLKT